jgi:hypothetical protein
MFDVAVLELFEKNVTKTPTKIGTELASSRRLTD